MYDIYELNEKSLVELKEIALQLGIENINHTKEYTTSGGYMSETFWITDSGICLGYSGAYATETATSWDTSVTSFGVDLP